MSINVVTVTEANIRTKKTQIFVPMTMEQMKENCPNLLNGSPSSCRSDKYQAINIYNDIVTPLTSKGWFVRQATSENSKKYGNKGKFVIRMANSTFSDDERGTELVIQSSHNGTKAVTFKMGIIEFMCNNGLVVMTDDVKELSDITITHKGNVQEKLDRVLEIVTMQTMKLRGLVTKMKSTILTPSQMKELAERALELRKVSAVNLDMELAIKTALQSPTKYDETIVGQDGDSLFDVFQRIQGNISKGMVYLGENKKFAEVKQILENKELYDDNQVKKAEYAMNKFAKQGEYGGMRKLRLMTNANRDIKWNEELFSTALEYAVAEQ